MFLNYLRGENRERFLKVCVYASLSNEIFADEERDMIFAYCREMELDEHVPETAESLEELLKDVFNHTDSKERNIFILEILGLVQSDGSYDAKEVDFMNMLIEGLKVNVGVLSKFTSLLAVYNVVCKELFATINE